MSEVIGGISVRVSPDTSGFGSQMRAAVRAATAALRPTVQVDADTGGAQRDLAGFSAAADAATRDRTVTIDVDRDGALRSLSGVGGVLRSVFDTGRGGPEQAAQGLNSFSQAAQRLGGSVFGQLGGGLAQLGTRLTGITAAGPAAAVGVAAFTAAVTVAAGLATAAAAGVIGLGAALAQLAGLAGAAGAGLAAIGQAAGTVLLGFSGIGEAVKAVNAEQTATAATAMKGARQQVTAANSARAAQERIADAARRVADAQRQAARAGADAAERVGDAQKALARTQQQVAEQISQAQERIAEVSARVALAREDAARRVADADERVGDTTRRLADVQRDAQKAQVDLSRARQDAADRLRDLDFQLRRASLSQEEAALSLEEAEERLRRLGQRTQQAITVKQFAELRKLGLELTDTAEEVDSLERRRAQLNVQGARFALEEARRRTAELQEEQAVAQRRGVDGDERVIDARERVADANRRVADAERDLGRAQADAARARRDAQRQVADALDAVRAAERDLQRTRRDGQQQLADAADAVADAQRDAARVREDAARSVADAARDLQRAQEDAGAAAAQAMGVDVPAATIKARQAMDELSPAGRRFVRFIVDELQPALDRLRYRAQEALLPGVQAGLQQLLTLEPLVGTAIDKTGRKLGELAVRGAEMLTSGPWRRDFVTITDGGVKVIDHLGGVVLNAADAARILTAEGLPLLLRITDLAERASAGAVAFLEQKRATGELSEFFRQAGDRLEQLLRIAGNTFMGLVDLGRTFLPIGDSILDVFERGSETFRSFSEGVANSPIMQATVRLAAAALREAFDTLFDAIDRNQGALRAVGAALLTVGVGTIVTVITTVAGAIEVFGRLAQAAVGMASTVVGAFARLTGAAASAAEALGMDSLASRLRTAEREIRGVNDTIRGDWLSTASTAENSFGRQASAADQARDAQQRYAQEVRQRTDEIRSAFESQVPAFQEVTVQADLTADGILDTLRRNRDAMQEASDATRELLARGVDPAIVEELALAGPGYIAQFKGASDEQLADLETIFRDRTQAATDGATAIAGAGGDATGTAFSDGLRGTLPQINSSFLDAVNSPASQALLGTAPSTGRQGGEATGLGFSTSLGNQAYKAKEAGGRVAGDAQGGLNPAISGAGGIGSTAGQQFAALLRMQEYLARSAGDALYRAQRDALRASVEASAGIGRDSGSRYAGGAREQEGAARGAGGGLAGQLAQGMRDAFENLKETGRNAAKRVLEGFSDVANRVRGVGSAFGSAVGRAMGDGLGGAVQPGTPSFAMPEGGQARDGQWTQIASFMRGTGTPHRITSTVRPGARTATGNLSRHALGKAVDFAAPRPGDASGLMRIWAALTKMGGLRELIYSPAPYQIFGGRVAPGPPRNGTVRAQHYDHVHAAFAKGGLVTEPVYGIGMDTGRSYSFAEYGPERVTSITDTARDLGRPMQVTYAPVLNAVGLSRAEVEQLLARERREFTRELRQTMTVGVR